jgi:hypothetical protein
MTTEGMTASLAMGQFIPDFHLLAANRGAPVGPLGLQATSESGAHILPFRGVSKMQTVAPRDRGIRRL